MRSISSCIATFVSMLAATLGIMFGSGSVAAEVNLPISPAAAVYYLNTPESIVHPGLLADVAIPPGQRFRVFFHYRNLTGKDQPLTIGLRITPGNPTTHRRWGIAQDFLPEIAGRDAAASFSRMPVDVDGGPLVVRSTILPGETVSGMLEGVAPSSGDTWLTARLGNGPRVKGSKVIVSHNLERLLDEVSLCDQGRFSYCRFGLNFKDGVDGEYGTRVLWTVRSASEHPLWVRLSVSPRGGPLFLVYRRLGNNQVIVTSRLTQYREYALGKDIELQPGEAVTIETFPIGGVNYPVELRAKVVKH